MQAKSIDLGGIIFSRYDKENRSGEQFISDHYIAFIISGELRMIDGDRTWSFKPGEVAFFKKNNLAKFIKVPAAGGYIESISILLNQASLTKFVEEQHPILGQGSPTEDIVNISPDNLLKTYFNSLSDYFEEQIRGDLIDSKKQELIHLLIRKDPRFKNTLFDFNVPGKIDLELFMNRNFRYNVNLDKLAFLTGRSLATFKRDFQKIFKMPPNRWLQQKRLKEAHYLLAERQLKPSEVYLEVGFESLPHFSYSFKQFFGKTPSSLIEQ